MLDGSGIKLSKKTSSILEVDKYTTVPILL